MNEAQELSQWEEGGDRETPNILFDKWQLGTFELEALYLKWEYILTM